MSRLSRQHPFFAELKILSGLAWPLLIAQVTQTLMGVVDTVMAGRYSSVDMAAVAIGVGLTLPLMVFIQGVTLALSPVVSRFDGAKKYDDVASKVQQMLYLSLALAFTFMLLYLPMPYIIAAIDMEAEVAQKSLDYVFFVFMAAPGFAIYSSLRNYCEGLSLTRPTMEIMFAGLCVNIPVNYIFINGLYGMPELGGAGCGLATMMVFYVMALATIAYVKFSKRLRHIKLFEKVYPFSRAEIKDFIKLGFPIAFTLLFEVSLFATVALLLAPFGALTVAAHQITLNVSSLIFMLPLSIGLALAIRIGYLIGEGRSKETNKAYWAGMLLAVGTVFVTATTIVLFNEQIASLYTTELPVIAAAASLLLLAALFQFSDAIQVVSANALRGYKDTRAMFILSFISYWLVGFPTGIILGLTDLVVPKMAAEGFWIGFIVGLSTAAVMMFYRVKVIQGRLIAENAL